MNKKSLIKVGIGAFVLLVLVLSVFFIFKTTQEAEGRGFCIGELNCHNADNNKSLCNSCSQCSFSFIMCSGRFDCSVWDGNESGCLGARPYCIWGGRRCMNSGSPDCKQVMPEERCEYMSYAGCQLEGRCMNNQGSCEACNNFEECNACSFAGCSWQGDNPPYWSNNTTSVPKIYSPQILSNFSIEWRDDHGVSTVLLESNFSGIPQNYTMNNSNGIYVFSSVLPAGIHYWKSYAEDTSNQWNSSDTWIFTIEKAPSEIALYLNGTRNNRTYRPGETAEIKCDLLVPETGFVYLYTTYPDNNMKLIAEENDPLILQQLLEVRGKFQWLCNWTGNQNYTSSSESWFTIVEIQDNFPVVTLDSPPNNHISNSQIINFTCTAYDDFQLVNVTLYGNFTGTWNANETNTTPQNKTPVTFQIRVAEGTYVWNCYACDNASQCSFAPSNYTLHVDTSLPVITFISPTPANNSYISIGNVTIAVNVTDMQSNISSCILEWQGVNESMNITRYDRWAICNATKVNLSQGTYTYRVYANDTGGNMNVSETRILHIDLTNPLVTLGIPVNNSFFSSRTINFSLKCADNMRLSTLQLWGNFTGTWHAN
ncbi:MAG: hypothetical protein NZ889_00830, partial [Candidatus Pacearchaeota archaeon]|nr:hypothetical protein [Candidatus Pacearchaeota archaeon]